MELNTIAPVPFDESLRVNNISLDQFVTDNDVSHPMYRECLSKFDSIFMKATNRGIFYLESIFKKKIQTIRTEIHVFKDTLINHLQQHLILLMKRFNSSHAEQKYIFLSSLLRGWMDILDISISHFQKPISTWVKNNVNEWEARESLIIRKVNRLLKFTRKVVACELKKKHPSSNLDKWDIIKNIVGAILSNFYWNAILDRFFWISVDSHDFRQVKV